MPSQFKKILTFAIVLALFSVSISAFAVWAPPSTTPPGNNTPSPINVGALLQEKVGAIVAGGLATPVFQMTTTPAGSNVHIPGYVLASDAAGFGSWVDVNTLITGGGGGTGNGPWTRTGNVTYLVNSGDRVGIGWAISNPTPTQQLALTESMLMPPTTSSITGVIYKGGNRFIHNYKNNTFLGKDSGNFTLSSENSLTGVGVGTLKSVTSGARNTAVGHNALTANTTGSDNTSIGTGSMSANTVGKQNVAVGTSAMDSNIFGEFNTAIGDNVMTNNVSGSNNTAIGSNALLSNNGNGNTGVGRLALQHNFFGSNNTAVGYNAGVALPPGEESYSNTIAIGNNVLVNANNKARIGNAVMNWIGGQVGWSAGSDARFKKNIQDLDLGLDFIKKLRPVSYQMKTDTDDRLSFGFIAQEVEKVLDSRKAKLVDTEDTPDSMKYMRYNDLIAPLVNAIQEQQEEIASLKKEIEILKAKEF